MAELSMLMHSGLCPEARVPTCPLSCYATVCSCRHHYNLRYS